MTMQHADVNGIRIAYGVRGSGPPLVLIMGYRLSSLAWPLDFIEALAKRFTVVLFDNRGTGTSDKPTSGYEISNMARDVSGLLDHLEIARVNVLGYSMGGAIAQEFVRQFPDRVFAVALCATMCGGPRAVYASPSVVRVMRELDGLKPEEIARRIWTVTYSPGYLENHRELAKIRCDARSQRQPPCTLRICSIRRLRNSIALRRLRTSKRAFPRILRAKLGVARHGRPSVRQSHSPAAAARPVLPQKLRKPLTE